MKEKIKSVLIKTKELLGSGTYNPNSFGLMNEVIEAIDLMNSCKTFSVAFPLPNEPKKFQCTCKENEVPSCKANCNHITKAANLHPAIDREGKPRNPAENSPIRPNHYGGEENPFEPIKVIEAWGIGFHLGNTVKYIARAGKKSNAPMLDDLKKARWYLNREIENIEKSKMI